MSISEFTARLQLFATLGICFYLLSYRSICDTRLTKDVFKTYVFIWWLEVRILYLLCVHKTSFGNSTFERKSAHHRGKLHFSNPFCVYHISTDGLLNTTQYVGFFWPSFLKKRQSMRDCSPWDRFLSQKFDFSYKYHSTAYPYSNLLYNLGKGQRL